MVWETLKQSLFDLPDAWRDISIYILTAVFPYILRIIKRDLSFLFHGKERFDLQERAVV